MKKAANELVQFIAGVLMLVSGLFIFSQKVVVSSGFFSGGFHFGGFQITNGIIIIPLIAGIIWMFISGCSLPSKLMTGFGILVIILSIILSTNISLVRMRLFDWIVILTLIFGGLGLLIKILLVNPRQQNREKSQADRIEEELERIKRNK